MGRSITVEGDFLMEEEKCEGKSESRIRAEEMAEEICAKSTALKNADYEELVLRLQKSMVKAQKKRDFEKYMKDGVRFVTENSDRIFMYKIIKPDLGCIIGVGIMALDQTFRRFGIATCICAPPDFERWSDKTAKGYIGNRIRESSSIMSFENVVDPEIILRGIHLRIISDACLGVGPAFLRKAIEICSNDLSFVEEIRLGRKGKKEVD